MQKQSKGTAGCNHTNSEKEERQPHTITQPTPQTHQPLHAARTVEFGQTIWPLALCAGRARTPASVCTTHLTTRRSAVPTPSLIKAMMNSTDSEEQRVVMNAIVSTTAAIETSELLVHEQNKHGRAHRYTDKHTHTRTQTSTQTSTRTHAQRPTLLTVFRVCLRCCIENAVEGRLHVGGWRVKHANHALGEKLLENAHKIGSQHIHER